MRAHKSQLAASIAAAMSGALWGLFWVPMRALEARGFEGGWGAVAMFAPAALIALVVVPLRARSMARAGWPLLGAGTLLGAGMVFYADGLVMTEVVRVLLLFYLTPVWSTLILRVVFGERVTPTRLAAITMGVLGLIVILDLGTAQAGRHNAGDVLALLSGLVWALGSIIAFRHQRAEPLDLLCVFLVAGLAGALGLALTALFDGAPPPTADTFSGGAVLIIVIGFIITAPTMYAVLWATKILEPARVGILLMLEVVVGIGSAALYSGEVFGAREALGATLIVGAGAIEVLASRAEAARSQAAA